MTGWDYHGGWSHPVYDGFVVCDEHVETLVDAWQVSYFIPFVKKKRLQILIICSVNLTTCFYYRRQTKNKKNVNGRRGKNEFMTTGEDWSEVC